METYCDDPDWNYHYQALDMLVSSERTRLSGGEIAAIRLGDHHMLLATRLDGASQWIITTNDQETGTELGAGNGVDTFAEILAGGWRGVAHLRYAENTPTPLWGRLYDEVASDIYNYEDDDDGTL